MNHLQSLLEKELNRSFSFPLSFVCINTAEPKYLVFEEDFSCPIYVMQIGEASKLGKIDCMLRRLWELLPDSVPEPILFRIVSGSQQALFIQSGLVGYPWFTLRSRIKSNQQFRTLVQRSTKALQKFQRGVINEPRWHTKINLSTELKKIGQSYKKLNRSDLPLNFDTKLQLEILNLKELPDVECYPQHGDFCLNNLIFDREIVSLVDFEYFGRVYMPYMDEFLLFASLVDFVPNPQVTDLDEIWKAVSENSYYKSKISGSHLSGIYMFFLMWWYIETNENERRKKRGDLYRQLLEKHCLYLDTVSSWLY
jgi:hypothetical protein